LTRIAPCCRLLIAWASNSQKLGKHLICHKEAPAGEAHALRCHLQEAKVVSWSNSRE